MKENAIQPHSDPESPKPIPSRRRVLSLVTWSWIFGAIWANAVAGAPLTSFATALGLNYTQFGYLAAVPYFAALLSVPGSLLIDRTGQRKRIFLVGLMINRLFWIPMALIPIWITSYYGAAYPWAIYSFLAFYLLLSCGQSVGGPAWISWMADVVPDRLRGRYFSRRRQLGILTAMPAALIAGWVLDGSQSAGTLAGDRRMLWLCAGIFVFAVLPGMVDILLFIFVPHQVHTRKNQSMWKMFSAPLHNSRFMWFSACVGMLFFSVVAQGQFINKYLLDHMHIHSLTVQMMILVAPLMAQFLVLGVWGRVIDRYGKRPALVICMLGLVPVGMGWCLMNTGHIWMGYILTMAGAVLWAGVDITNFNLVIDLSGSDEDGAQGGTAYVAMNSIILNFAGCLGGVFFGWLAQRLKDFSYDPGISWMHPFSNYEVLFLVSVILRIAAVLLILPRVKEHDAKPTVLAFRYMASNLYSNLVSTAMLPTKFIKQTHRRMFMDGD